MTGPRVYINGFAYLCAYRVSVNIAQKRKKITVFSNKDALIATSKQLPIQFFTPVIPLGIHPVNVPHHAGQVSTRSLNEQVIMIR